jgi:tRNA (guanine37-N1)-methyltransferase
MKITIITLFPEVFDKLFNSSMLWKAQKIKAVEFELIDLREFGLGPRRQVDDTPYGGGDGMLLMIEPLVAALEKAKETTPGAKVLIMTPDKNEWTQKKAADYATEKKNLIIICGHYEGFDARIFKYVDEKISLGKFILTGGEIPAMAVVDSIVRLLPGVLGGKESAEIESYSHGGNIEFPQYTRPEVFNDESVPAVLLSGNHGEIEKWRKDSSRS